MKLFTEGKSFELKVLSYESQASTSYHDSNWLKIRIDAIDGDLMWSAEDYCLTTYELSYLKDWICTLEDSDDSEIFFTEHEIAFKFCKTNCTLTILFVLKFHPVNESDVEYKMDFILDSNKIRALSNALETWGNRYPQRNK